MLKYSLLLLVLVCNMSLQAQQINYAVQDSALSRFRNDYPQEDVFLQTDKQYYIAGETIWFKAWCTNNGVPSFLSRILYVDITNSAGSVVEKKMYKLDSLSSISGDISIPQTWKSGNFSVNAYTLWMLNFPSFISRKAIFVYGNDYAPANTASARPAIKMSFYPEGGDLVAGLSSRVAFKITNEKNLPVNLSGTVQDAQGKKVADITSEHDGMGVFEFVPASGQEYTAHLSTAGGTAKLSFKLPKAKEEGIVLKIENAGASRLVFMINRAEKNKQAYRKLKVIAQINYEIVYAMGFDMDELQSQAAAAIPKKNLPPGIIQVTVFDEKDLPLVERIAFIENYSLNSPVITMEKKNLKARGVNLLSFTTANTDLASLSCLVSTWSAKQDTAWEDNIASSLLASSQLQGYINKAGYYFKDKTPSTLRHLDLLLLTQGWRRFEWTKLLNNQFAQLTYPVESGITFRGTLLKSDRKEPIKDGRVSFIIKGADSTSILAEASTTDKGEFLLSDVNYMQNAKVSYMGTNKNRETLIVDVKLIENYIDSLKKSGNLPLANIDTLNGTIPNSLQQQLAAVLGDSSVKILTGVTVKARRMSKEDSLNNEYAGGPFLMGKSIDPSNYKYYNTIWQMIQASVPGVTVEGNPFDPDVKFSRFAGLGNPQSAGDVGGGSDELSEALIMQENGIAYFLNEVNVTKDIINTLQPEDIALIKVLKNEAAVLGASQGAIAIYTKRGVSASKAVYEKTYKTEDHLGYAVSREFAQPLYVYDNTNKDPDNRTTLYWNGKIKPAKDGKFRFQFYNNDFGTKARIVIQGIDKEGQLIYREMILE